jgi:hypothetical protein
MKAGYAVEVGIEGVNEGEAEIGIASRTVCRRVNSPINTACIPIQTSNRVDIDCKVRKGGFAVEPPKFIYRYHPQFHEFQILCRVLWGEGYSLVQGMIDVDNFATAVDDIGELGDEKRTEGLTHKSKGGTKQFGTAQSKGEGP